MKTVLVTGATGSFGDAVVAFLRKEDECRVFATGRRTCAGVDFQLDVSDSRQVASAIDRIKPDIVLHLAATFSNVFDEAFTVNVQAARLLLDAVQQSGLRTRVVLVGSAAEYGVVTPADSPIREDHVLNPVSIYGVTKAWQTQLAGLYSSRNVDVVVARIFNLDGPGLSERLFVGRLQRQIESVLAGRQSTIELGPLTATRDYISTEEAAEQLIAIARRGQAGRVYHVASGRPVTMREILDRYLAIHKLDYSIVREAAELTNRTGYDVPRIYANIENTLQLMKVGRVSDEA